MAVFYNEGETKTRPGVYQRFINTGYNTPGDAQDGICAIPIQAGWGPLGKVVKNTSAADLEKNYGSGEYGTAYTVPAAAAMFDGGASVVYTYRMGTGGTASSLSLKDTASASASAVKITAKFPGNKAFTCTVRAKLGDSSKKEVVIYDGTKEFEKYTIAAGDSVDEAANLVAAAKNSSNFTFVKESGYSGNGVLATVANSEFTAGTNPTVSNSDYSAAFAAFESVYYNTISIDKDDDESLTLSLLLQSYLDSAYQTGKLGIAVVGEKTSVDFADRCAHSRAFNDAKVVYLGTGYQNAAGENVDGVMAICYTAGVIAAKPSNQGITHTTIKGATDVIEHLTYAQYEEAIECGMLMLSVSPDGMVWYDSGITTLVDPESQDIDHGWQKIRRVKVRFEMIDRLDHVLAPKVGNVSADSDGVADIVQSGQRVIDSMVNEGKLMAGASFVEDPERPYVGDSAWFIIQADDIDSLEKIYLQYRFRYSQNS